MQRFMLQSKIHRAKVTQADLHYVGSLTIDRDLMDAADLWPGQQVDVVDVDNGSRLTTYAIEGERGPRDLIRRRAAQEEHRLRDLLRRGEFLRRLLLAQQGHLRGLGRQLLGGGLGVDLFLHQRRQHPAGADRDARYAAACGL